MAVYGAPRSLWCTSPQRLCRRRFQIAISSASRARSACKKRETRQPTMKWLKTSISEGHVREAVLGADIGQVRHPQSGGRRGCDVIPDPEKMVAGYRYTVNGRLLRSTRSSGRVSTSVAMVVVGLRLPRTTPSRSSKSISTRSRPTWTPSRLSWCQTFSILQTFSMLLTPKFSRCTRAISTFSSWSRRARLLVTSCSGRRLTSDHRVVRGRGELQHLADRLDPRVHGTR